MATHTETRYHVHGQAEPDDTGKLGAMKVARPVWRGPIEKRNCKVTSSVGYPTAIDASTRMFLGGVVSVHRDRDLADRLLRQVRACCQRVQAILICTDGWNAYPKSIMRAFRDKVKKTAGQGRACLEVWPELCIATVIKHTKKKQVVEITRKITLGPREKARALLQMTKGCKEFNTSLIERFNGTMRERLASLTRKCRHAAHRL